MLSMNSTISEIAQAHKKMGIKEMAIEIKVNPNELKRVFKYLGFEYINKYRKWSCIYTDYVKNEYLERSLCSIIEEMERNLIDENIPEADQQLDCNRENLEFTQNEIKVLKKLAQQQLETRMDGNISNGSTAILEAVKRVPSGSTSKKTFVIQDSVIEQLNAFCDSHRIKKSDFLAVAILEALRKYDWLSEGL